MAARFFGCDFVPSGTMPDEQSPSEKESSGEKDRRQASEWHRLSGLAFEFLAYIGVLGYLGWRLDQHYGWNNWGLFGGLVLGLVAWIYRVLRQTRDLFR